MKIIQNFAIAIDNLRISKGLTVRDLCLDICDESSYRRYRLGDRDIPIARIKQFCDRLGIELDEFLYNVYTKNSYEYQKIHRLFYDLQIKDYDAIKKSIPQIRTEGITLHRNKILFELILHTYHYETKKITKSEYHKLLTSLLPSHTGFYTFNDIMILEKLAFLEVPNNETNALNQLHNILLDTKRLYSISENYSMIATLYANVPNLYTKLKDLEHALVICDRGISYSERYNVTKNIHHLYYLKAYCLFHSGNHDDAMENLSIVISLVFGKQDKRLFQYFIELIIKEFNMTKPMIYQMHQLSIQNYV
ncbi:MAG: helix-turn-helix domain-containing protein [Acholeplasmataceae bacterium]|jgi:transcriptional regulator with XRE-family HTH domain